MNTDKELTPEILKIKLFDIFQDFKAMLIKPSDYENMVRSIIQDYGRQQFEAGRQESKWIPVSVEPEFDGDHLCFIVRKNECGTFSKYQRVVELRMNKWVIADSLERVTHYQKLGPEPERTVQLLSAPDQGKERKE